MVKIKSQTNYYVTETCFELPARLEEIHELLRISKNSGELISMYNSGGVLGVSVKQRTKVHKEQDAKVREILGIKNTVV